MIGMLICGLLRGPRPSDTPAEPASDGGAPDQGPEALSSLPAAFPAGPELLQRPPAAR